MTLILVVIASELLTMRLATVLADILGERFARFHDPSVLYYGIPFAFGALLTTLLVDVNPGILDPYSCHSCRRFLWRYRSGCLFNRWESGRNL